MNFGPVAPVACGEKETPTKGHFEQLLRKHNPNRNKQLGKSDPITSPRFQAAFTKPMDGEAAGTKGQKDEDHWMHIAAGKHSSCAHQRISSLHHWDQQTLPQNTTIFSWKKTVKQSTILNRSCMCSHHITEKHFLFSKQDAGTCPKRAKSSKPSASTVAFAG